MLLSPGLYTDRFTVIHRRSARRPRLGHHDGRLRYLRCRLRQRPGKQRSGFQTRLRLLVRNLKQRVRHHGQHRHGHSPATSDPGIWTIYGIHDDVALVCCQCCLCYHLCGDLPVVQQGLERPVRYLCEHCWIRCYAEHHHGCREGYREAKTRLTFSFDGCTVACVLHCLRDLIAGDLDVICPSSRKMECCKFSAHLKHTYTLHVDFSSMISFHQTNKLPIYIHTRISSTSLISTEEYVPSSRFPSLPPIPSHENKRQISQTPTTPNFPNIEVR